MLTEQLPPSQHECGGAFQEIARRWRRVITSLALVAPAGASLFQAGGVPVSVHAEDEVSVQYGIEAQWVPPPTGPRTQEELFSVEEEVQAISIDIKAIADAVRTWVRPEMLKKYPDLNSTQLADDPQQLKAYIEAGYLRKDNLYFNDIRTEQDEVVSFMPEGPRGSRFITIYKRPDGTVYKVRIGLITDGKGSLITQYSRPNDGIPPDKLPSVTEGVFNVGEANLVWRPGEFDSKEHPNQEGEGQVGNIKVSVSAASEGFVGFNAEDLQGSGQQLTPEQIAAREQKRQAIHRAKIQKLHDETRKPPVVDNTRAALTAGETNRLTKDLAIAVDVAKQWVKPEVLAANPVLTDTSAAADPKKLKAYRDRGYIDEEFGQFIADAQSPNDKIITFRPYGEQGGIVIRIYQSADGKIYKGRIFAVITSGGSLTSSYLQEGKVTKDDLPRVIERVVRLPEEVQWEMGENAEVTPHLRAEGEIDNYFVKIEGSGGNHPAFMIFEFAESLQHSVPNVTPFIGVPGLSEH